MQEFLFNITNWSAWAPGLISKDDWKSWALDKKSFAEDLSDLPSVDFIPPMLRRRLSQLTRMCLKTAHECGLENSRVPSVFASRYGELEQTLKLLKSISDAQDFSPAGFSLSVHNTAAGINSIISKNTQSYTTVSACEETFEMALLEALGRLQNHENILLVLGEEFIKELYQTHYFHTPFSVAFLLGKSGGQKIKMKFGEEKINDSSQQDSGLRFLKWLLSNSEKNFSTKLFSLEKIK